MNFDYRKTFENFSDIEIIDILANKDSYNTTAFEVANEIAIERGLDFQNSIGVQQNKIIDNSFIDKITATHNILKNNYPKYLYILIGIVFIVISIDLIYFYKAVINTNLNDLDNLEKQATVLFTLHRFVFEFLVYYLSLYLLLKHNSWGLFVLVAYSVYNLYIKHEYISNFNFSMFKNNYAQIEIAKILMHALCIIYLLTPACINHYQVPYLKEINYKKVKEIILLITIVFIAIWITKQIYD